MTDATGATPATYAYSAFGSTRASTGTIANEVRFTGERTDTESGLEFLRARTYDPSTGTFLQRDSWGISPTDGQSIDAYAYTANNPINATDPSGHLGCRYDREDCSEIAQATKAAISHGGFGGLWGTPPKPGKKADSAPQASKGCDPNPFAGNSCFGQGINVLNQIHQRTGGAIWNAGTDTLNQIHQRTGGAAFNWAAAHPVETVVIAAGIGICAAALELCLAGMAGYTATTAIPNVPGAITQGQPILAGWNPVDALMAGSGAALVGPFSGGGNVMNPVAGFGVGMFTDAVGQKIKDPGGSFNRFEAACQGLAGAGSTQFSPNRVGWIYGTFTAMIANGTCGAVTR